MLLDRSRRYGPREFFNTIHPTAAIYSPRERMAASRILKLRVERPTLGARSCWAILRVARAGSSISRHSRHTALDRLGLVGSGRRKSRGTIRGTLRVLERKPRFLEDTCPSKTTEGMSFEPCG